MGHTYFVIVGRTMYNIYQLVDVIFSRFLNIKLKGELFYKNQPFVEE